jgi:predicted molibdopterin-dependent oxidoreductase YjgC
MVEIIKGKKRKLVASCCYPAEEGLVVTTESQRINKIRKLILELIWPAASEKLYAKYGLTSSRFEGQQEDCSLCGLCVRYCNDVAKKGVVYFQGRGIDRHVALTPGVDEFECDGCCKCFHLCKGGFLMSERRQFGG